ncbi:hypothetical protein BJ508DRAFT_416195 [Ascobolus immersus RN42]|uniref:SH3 domain-containing protein n=1 Tax=Ascobolus immersus RN42 TaxID=1160509 RepID=A0A3N4HZ18_ASCIM|nr:hypothetical protein BJ508DRAFT_416195 [Ascobolus immersus RN42]
MVHNHRRQHDHRHVKRVAEAEPQVVEVVSKIRSVISSVSTRVESAIESARDARNKPAPVETVYVTASQTFSGKPAGYITVTGGDDEPKTKAPAPTSKPQPKPEPESTTKAAAAPSSPAKKPPVEEEEEEEEEKPAPKPAKSTPPVQTTLSTVKKPATSTLDSDQEIETDGALAATPTSTNGAIIAGVPPSTSLPTSSGISSISASATPEPTGLSAGATGGLIGGGVALLLIALAFAGFLYRRRQQKVIQEAYGKPEDEKFGMAAGAAPMAGAAAGGAAVAGFNEKHYSQQSSNFASGQVSPAPISPGFGAPAAMGAAAIVAAKRQSTQQPKRFSYQERAEQVAARRQSQQMLAQGGFQAPQQQQFQAPQQPQQFQAPQQFPQQAPAPFVPVPIVNPPRNQQQRGPQQPPAIAIPDSTQFAAPPVNPFAGGSAPGTPNPDATIIATPTITTPGTPSTPTAGVAGPVLPVYRVIMEFKPSMGDELELIPGDIVRLMHEYDDGWALCSRMNGSAQGVCPRTCLSPRPLKPRNGTVGSQNGGPNGTPFSPVTAGGAPAPFAGPQQGSRPGTPTGMKAPAAPQTPTGMKPAPKPASPSQYKPYTPPAGSRPGTPKVQSRPQTPTGQRSAQATPQSSPPRIREQQAPGSPVIPQIMVSPSDEQPASPILGPVDVSGEVKPLAAEAKEVKPKVSSPLAQEVEKVEEKEEKKE